MTEKIKKPIAYITPSLSIRDQYDAVIQRPEIGDMLALLTYAQTMSTSVLAGAAGMGSQCGLLS